MAMLACSRSRIGVDIERIDESKLEAVAAACHQVEIEVLERADDPATLFAQIWTAKEACLKADGRGLTIDPRTLCVVDDHGCPAELVQIPGSAPWQIQHVAVDSHHVAALASKAGDAVDVIQRHWFG
ncbi:4'-phosphopantetheinyl transferase family protein [Roseateles sp. BYS180W]|uniref:4'-phosphopantetheinyl transferase family protein n=1 Tax=Roseateles rivi TaxID=3299028 RepID=A0ABW7FXN2_9BURK